MAKAGGRKVSRKGAAGDGAKSRAPSQKGAKPATKAKGRAAAKASPKRAPKRADADAPEEVSSKATVAPIEAPEPPKRKRKRQRRKLDEDVLAALEGEADSDDGGAKDKSDANPPVPHASYRGKRTRLGDVPPKDVERVAEGGVKVKRLRQKPAHRAGREPPAEVKSFLSDHFYGERLRRTAGVANRRRGMRAAKVFAVK